MTHFHRIAFYALAAVTLTATSATAWQLTQAYTYSGVTGQPVTIAWQPDPAAERYLVKLWHLGHRQNAHVLETADTRATLTPPASGLYQVHLRSIDSAGNYSPWYRSHRSKSANVGATPTGWQLFAWLAPAAGPEID